VTGPGAVRLAGCFLVLACSHDAPLQPGSYAPNVPPGSGSLVRLTFNVRADRSPVWLPDGSGFFYSRERDDRDDLDRCLALLPASGGSIEREICDRTAAADDSVNAFSAPAIDADGRLAYVRASAPLDVGRPLAPRYHELVVARLDDPLSVRVLQSMPYQGPSGRGHEEITQVRWVADSVLVYVGQHVAYIGACPQCPPDTLPSGLEIVRLDYRGPVPILTMLPGSDQASSIAFAAPDTVFFTVNGDSRVFSLSLSTDSVRVVHDFGAAGIARDVQVAGHRLLAVVGGNVAFFTDPSAGPIQRDDGGPIILVDRDTGTETPLGPLGFMFRHPALDSSGTRIIAELVLAGTTDLWLLEVP
jgi:hypothetical protein